MHKYYLYDKGAPVAAGTQLTDFRGKHWRYKWTNHPNKLYVEGIDSPWSQEFYPSVFDTRHDLVICECDDSCSHAPQAD